MIRRLPHEELAEVRPLSGREPPSPLAVRQARAELSAQWRMRLPALLRALPAGSTLDSLSDEMLDALVRALSDERP